MVVPRNQASDFSTRLWDLENANLDSPVSKKASHPEARYPLTKWEMMTAASVFLLFILGILCIFMTMPKEEFMKIMKLPSSVSELRELKGHLAVYAKDYQVQFMLGYCSVYIFMQTFMIPGTIFLSLLAGALYGVARGIVLVIFTATAGASSCYFLSKLIGKPIAYYLWPEKLRFFQAEIAKRKENLLNYMLFLRITPTLPNTFINVASPIVDVPYYIFFLATFFGIIPATYVTVRAGLALGELKSLRDLYDMKTLSVLFLIGFVAVFPVIWKRKQKKEDA